MTQEKYGFSLSKTLANARSKRPGGVLQGMELFVCAGTLGPGKKASSQQRMKSLIELFCGIWIKSQQELSNDSNPSSIIIVGETPESPKGKLGDLVDIGAHYANLPDFIEMLTKQSNPWVSSKPPEPKKNEVRNGLSLLSPTSKKAKLHKVVQKFGFKLSEDVGKNGVSTQTNTTGM